VTVTLSGVKSAMAKAAAKRTYPFFDLANGLHVYLRQSVGLSVLPMASVTVSGVSFTATALPHSVYQAGLLKHFAEDRWL
jgi:hypothetical protein